MSQTRDNSIPPGQVLCLSKHYQKEIAFVKLVTFLVRVVNNAFKGLISATYNKDVQFPDALLSNHSTEIIYTFTFN